MVEISSEPVVPHLRGWSRDAQFCEMFSELIHKMWQVALFCSVGHWAPRGDVFHVDGVKTCRFVRISIQHRYCELSLCLSDVAHGGTAIQIAFIEAFNPSELFEHWGDSREIPRARDLCCRQRAFND
jgi:hypothetical protein